MMGPNLIRRARMEEERGKDAGGGRETVEAESDGGDGPVRPVQRSGHQPYIGAFGRKIRSSSAMGTSPGHGLLF